MKVPLHELRVGNAKGEVSCTPCKDCKFNPDEQMHTTEILIKKENNSERRRNQLVPRAQKEATKKKPNTDEQRLHSAQQGWRAAG